MNPERHPAQSVHSQPDASESESRRGEFPATGSARSGEAVRGTLLPGCEEVRQNLVAYLKEELPPDRRGPLSVHLATCSTCAAEARSLAATLGIVRREPGEDSLAKLANMILLSAIREGASDIHVEPGEHGVRVRLRLDGVLHERMRLPTYVHAPLTAHLKIMADLNPAERRSPQDGLIRVQLNGKEYRLRASTFAFRRGEKVMMHLLPAAAEIPALERLGMTPRQESAVQALLRQPSGLLLVAGPAASGKRTLAYALLKMVDVEANNVVALTDSVRLVVPGVTQTQVDPDRLPYAVALRQLLQRDPDVILVGDVPEGETARAVVEAAAAGALVIAVTHARHAAGAVDRLLRLGVAGETLADSLVGVLSSRLLRRLCDQCAAPDPSAGERIATLGVAAGVSTGFRASVGCEACRFTGYRGRVGAFEVVPLTPTLAQAVIQGEGEESLSQVVAAAGVETLVAAAARLAATGVTSVEELFRVTADLCNGVGKDQSAETTSGE